MAGGLDGGARAVYQEATIWLMCRGVREYFGAQVALNRGDKEECLDDHMCRARGAGRVV
jgi:hypothetical protein